MVQCPDVHREDGLKIFMGIVYILQGENNKKYYIGSTNDLNRRLEQHNSGETGIKGWRPLRLVFYQSFGSLNEARRIETKLKKFKNRNIIEQIIADNKIRARS